VFWRLTKVCLVACALAGCGATTGGAEPAAAPTSEATLPPPSAPVGTPSFGDRTSIALLNRGQALRVGDSVERAFQIFPAPPKSYDFFELPPGFGRQFRARGWRTNYESFGVISHQGKVVLALRVLENATKEELEALVEELELHVPTTAVTISGKLITYWLWDAGNHRLAVCATPAEKGDYTITAAIGVAEAMSAIRLDAASAQSDLRTAENLLSRRSNSGS